MVLAESLKNKYRLPMDVPLLIVGNAASQYSTPLFAVFGILFIIAFFISRMLRNRYDRRFDGGS